MSGRIDLSHVTTFLATGDDLRARLDALDARLTAYRAENPTNAGEIRRLAHLALNLAEPSGPTYSTASEADRKEIDRLRQVATQLLTGEPAKDASASTTAQGDDAGEVERLRKLAQEMR